MHEVLILVSKKLSFLTLIVIIITVCFIVSPIVFNRGIFAQVSTGLEETAGKAGLPTGSTIPAILGQIIYAILGFLAVIFIILLIYGGFIRMTAQGNPEAIKKSMGIITSAVIGIIIIIASYTITAFVMSGIEDSVGGDGVLEDVDLPIDTGSGYRCCVNPNLLPSNPCMPANPDGTCPSPYQGDGKVCDYVKICQ